MNALNQNRKHYYFTWGTLKQGFPNHPDNQEVLGDLIGHFSTLKPQSLIVPLDRFCPNGGCRFVHRIGALTDAIKGHNSPLTGELYKVSDEGLNKLDALESYDPNNPKGSTYIRREIDLKNNTTEDVIRGFIYFIADASRYAELLAANRAEVVAEYTLEMAKGELKPCCKVNPQHLGDHDKLPFPTLEKQEELSQ